MCLMVNPMRNNWHEMPEFIRFANKHTINIWFNTIHRPIDWSIWALPFSELKKIYHQLDKEEFLADDRKGSMSAYNIAIYNNLVQVQIKNWMRESEVRLEIPQEKSNPLTEEDAKDVFEKKILDFVYQNFNESEEQKKHRSQQVILKAKKISSLLIERNGETSFYSQLQEAPTDIVYKQMESRTVNSLVEDFENRFIQTL